MKTKAKKRSRSSSSSSSSDSSSSSSITTSSSSSSDDTDYKKAKKRKYDKVGHKKSVEKHLKKKKDKKLKLKKKLKKKHNTRKCSSSSDSSSSDSDKKKKQIKKHKGKKSKQEKKSKVKDEVVPLKSAENDCFDIPVNLMDQSRSMVPMTKEEWEKRQSVVRKVYDESSGRTRLIKGDGEVIEQIVSRDQHKAINQMATKGDGEYFQTKLLSNLKN